MVEKTRTYPLPLVAHAARYAEAVLLRTAWISTLLVVVGGYLGFAHADGAFGMDPLMATAVARYLDNWLLVTSLGGVVGSLLLAAPVNYFKRVLIRASLNLHAEAPESRTDIPVKWQRNALEGKYVGNGLRLVGIGVVLVFGLFTAVTATLVAATPDDLGLRIVLGGTVVVTVLGVIATVLGFRRQKGPAVRHWADTRPAVDPRERSRELDSTRAASGLREVWRRIRRDHGLTTSAPGRLADVYRLEQTTGWLQLSGRAALGVSVAAAILPLALRQSCEDCDVRIYSPGTEALVDHLLRFGTEMLVLGLVLLLAAAVCGAVSSLRLRSTVLAAASDPEAQEPPWHLLRRLLLEEVPHQRILGSLHTWAVVAWSISAAGMRTGPEYPLSEWYRIFPALGTLGGVLMLFHVSGWFWHRTRTLEENESLLERWPGD